MTISEDLADGHSADLDASLKLLGEDDLKLLLPNNDYEDDEIHITDVAGNNALQDYQMQLMLLEQQNKKRLLLARQKQLRKPAKDKPFSDLGVVSPGIKVPTRIKRNGAASMAKRQKPNARSRPQSGQQGCRSSVNGEVSNKSDTVSVKVWILL